MKNSQIVSIFLSHIFLSHIFLSHIFLSHVFLSHIFLSHVFCLTFFVHIFLSHIFLSALLPSLVGSISLSLVEVFGILRAPRAASSTPGADGRPPRSISRRCR